MCSFLSGNRIILLPEQYLISNIDTNSNPKLSVSLKIKLIGHFMTLFEIKNKIFKKRKKLILKNYELDVGMKWF